MGRYRRIHLERRHWMRNARYLSSIFLQKSHPLKRAGPHPRHSASVRLFYLPRAAWTRSVDSETRKQIRAWRCFIRPFGTFCVTLIFTMSLVVRVTRSYLRIFLEGNGEGGISSQRKIARSFMIYWTNKHLPYNSTSFRKIRYTINIYMIKCIIHKTQAFLCNLSNVIIDDPIFILLR